MDRKYLIIGLVVVLLAASAVYFYEQHQANQIDFAVIKSPEKVTIQGDSARYTGRSKYTVYTTITNKTGKPLVYMPLFGLIRDQRGNKIGVALGNTGRLLKAGEAATVILETIIPKETGEPAMIELYSE